MMAAAIDTTRLARVLGMLGSDHAGEREAAGRQADKMVRAAGTTWHALLAPEAQTPHGTETSWRRDALTPGCLLATYGAALTPWEKGFLATLVRRPRWSTKQRAVLDEIRGRFT